MIRLIAEEMKGGFSNFEIPNWVSFRPDQSASNLAGIASSSRCQRT